MFINNSSAQHWRSSLQHHADHGSSGAGHPPREFSVAVYESFIRVAMFGSGYCRRSTGLGLVLLGYATVFRDVNASFNTFADFISNNTTSGADVFGVWMSDLAYAFNTSGFEKLFELVAGGVAGLIGALFVIVSYAVFPLTYAAFCFFYSLYGSVLYVLGPVVISLLPSFGIGPMARVYIVNVLTFHFWGVIYSISRRPDHRNKPLNRSADSELRRFHQWFRRVGTGAAPGRRLDFLLPLDRTHSVSGGADHSR